MGSHESGGGSFDVLDVGGFKGGGDTGDVADDDLGV